MPAETRTQGLAVLLDVRPAVRQMQGATRRLAAHGRDDRPGVVRSHECREGATGSCRTDSETRKFLKRVSACCAAQTRKARNSGSVAASTTRKAPARRQRRPSRALRVPGRRRRDARRGGKGGVRRFGARAAGAHQGGAWCTLPFRSERRPRGRAVRRASRAGPGRTRGRGWGVAVALVTAAEGWKRAVVLWRRGSASTRGSPESRALAKPWGEASRRRLRQPGRRCRRPSGARACLARRSARWPGSHGRR